MKRRQQYWLIVVFVALALVVGHVLLTDDLVDAAPFFVLTVLSGALVARVDARRREALVGWARGYGWVLPVVVYAATALSLQERDGKFLDFYEVSAQIIPVLILALVLEAQGFSLRHPIELTTLGLLAYGEFEALQALLNHDPSDGELVAAAIAAGFVGVAVVALTRDEENVRAQTRAAGTSSPDIAPRDKDVS